MHFSFNPHQIKITGLKSYWMNYCRNEPGRDLNHCYTMQLITNTHVLNLLGSFFIPIINFFCHRMVFYKSRVGLFCNQYYVIELSQISRRVFSGLSLDFPGSDPFSPPTIWSAKAYPLLHSPFWWCYFRVVYWKLN